jgi:hypothetical protein
MIDGATQATLAAGAASRTASADGGLDQAAAFQAALAQQYAEAARALCDGLMTLQAGPVKAPSSATDVEPPSLYA